VLAEGGSDGQVRLWNAMTGAPIAVIPHPQPVTSLAWDGPGVLITGDADGYARAARVPPPELLAGSAVNSVAWDTQASAAARSVCAMAGQPLTPAEWHAYVPGLPYAPPCR
jgi:WD40 repeat protein